MDAPLLWAGTVVCAAAAASALVLADRRRAAAAMLFALALAPALVLGDNWDSDRLADLRDRPALAAAGLVTALGALTALARLFAARPSLVPLLALAALPFRIPVDLGEDPANLLLPLYAVIAAGADCGDDPPRRASSGERCAAVAAAAPGAGAAVGRLRRPLRAAGGLRGRHLAGEPRTSPSSSSPSRLCSCSCREVEWDRPLLRAAGLILVAEALLFAVVGFGQYAIGELFWNEKVIEGNEAHACFRVNSLFWDPNIMGRYLMVLMIGVAAALAWARDMRAASIAAAIFAVLLVGRGNHLLAVEPDRRWSPGWSRSASSASGPSRGPGCAALAVAGMAVAVDAVRGRPDRGRDERPREPDRRRPRARRGPAARGPRIGLVQRGLSRALRRRRWRRRRQPHRADHRRRRAGRARQPRLSRPDGGRVLARRSSSPRSRPVPRPRSQQALFAAFVAMFVHSLGYAAFLTDPITWALLAAARLALTRRGLTACSTTSDA